MIIAAADGQVVNFILVHTCRSGSVLPVTMRGSTLSHCPVGVLEQDLVTSLVQTFSPGSGHGVGKEWYDALMCLRSLKGIHKYLNQSGPMPRVRRAYVGQSFALKNSLFSQ